MHGLHPAGEEVPRAAPPGEATESVPLSRATLGRVIGKHGAGLKQIREASGCQLEVSSRRRARAGGSQCSDCEHPRCIIEAPLKTSLS